MGDVVERVTRKNQDLVSQLPLTISAQYGLIDQNMFFDKRVASKDVSGYYLIYNGEFAYNKSTSSDAPWGAIKRLDRYENGVLSTLYIVFKIKNEKVINSDFLVTYYDTCNWHKDIKAVAAEGARNHGLLNIAPADFFKTELMLPQDIEEQKKIGSYFKLIDHLITLHQREFAFLCKEKSKKFRYIKNAWEQRKLSEIATMHARIGWQNLRTSEFLDNGDYMLITGTDFMDGAVNFDTCHYVERERYEQDKHIQIRNGSILITKDGTLGKVAYIQGLTMPATLNAGVFNVEIRDEKEVDNRYLFQYLKAPFLMDYVDKKATGGTIEDEQLLRRINITLKKTFGLWIYKEEKKENIRCLCPKCLKDYIHNPDYIVRRLDPFAKVKDHCDKCNQSGWDYVIAERQHNAREKGVSECLRKDMKL